MMRDSWHCQEQLATRDREDARYGRALKVIAVIPALFLAGALAGGLWWVAATQAAVLIFVILHLRTLRRAGQDRELTWELLRDRQALASALDVAAGRPPGPLPDVPPPPLSTQPPQDPA